MRVSLTEIFCDVDDFCKVFLPNWERRLLEESQTEAKNYKQAFSLSEVVTLVNIFTHRATVTLRVFIFSR